MGIWKWIVGGIGGILGWIYDASIGSFWCAVIGLFIGSAIDYASKLINVKKNSQEEGIDDFAYALIVMSAAVMKSNDVVKKIELEYVKQFFMTLYDKEKVLKILQYLKNMLKSHIPLNDACEMVYYNMSDEQKQGLINYLIGIAYADNNVTENEIYTLKYIAQKIGIDEYTFESIYEDYEDNTDPNIYYDLDSDYETLGITKDATNDEIKKAYKKLAMKHHPDKFAGMGEDVTRKATEKFQAINEAYDRIKKERDIS